MTIHKHIFEVVVLTEDLPDYDPDDTDFESGLHRIAGDIYDGDWIGSTRKLSSVEIPPDQVRDELLAIGNDGTFFELEPGNP